MLVWLAGVCWRRCVRAGPGSSRDPCSEQYNGWRAFSEPETRAIAHFILSLASAPHDHDHDSQAVHGGGALAIYVSLHSYGQHLLTPWGYTRRLPPHYDDLVSPPSAIHIQTFQLKPRSRHWSWSSRTGTPV